MKRSPNVSLFVYILACKTAMQDVVISRDGAELTLEQVFQTLRLMAYDLSIDTPDMHAHQGFHWFDNFNLKYNPIG